MKDSAKSKSQLISEITDLHQQISEFENSRTGCQEESRIQALAAVGNILISTLDLQDVLEQIGQHTLDSLGASATLVMSFNEEKDHLEGRAVAENSRLSKMVKLMGERAKHIVIPISTKEQDPIALVYSSGEPLLIPDITKVKGSKIFHLIMRVLGKIFNVRQIYTYPIQTKGRVVGVFSLGYSQNRKITQTDQDLIKVLANQSAIAIENAQLYSKAQEEIKNREQAEKSLRGSESKYHDLFEKIADPIFIFDQESHHFYDCNEQAIQQYGYSLEELRTMTPQDLHPHEEHARVNEEIADSDDSAPHQYTHITKGGVEISVEIRTGEVDYRGKPAWISIIRDITKRKQAEKSLTSAYIELEQRIIVRTADLTKTNKLLLKEVTEHRLAKTSLQKSEEKFRLIAETTSDIITITSFDLKAEYQYVSPSIKTLLGYDPEELIGVSVFKFIHPEDKKNMLLLLKTYLTQKVKGLLDWHERIISEVLEFRFKSKSGDWHYLQSTINLAGEKLITVNRDITEYKQSVEALAESESKYRLLAENSLDCIWTLDKSLRFTFLSPSLERIVGFRPDEWIGSRLKSHFTTKEYPVASRYALEAIKNFKNFGHVTFETKLLNHLNEEVEIEVIGGSHLDAKGKLIGLMGSIRDIKERKNAQKTLQMSEEKYRGLFDDSVAAVFVFDSEKNFIDTNQAGIDFLGYSRNEILSMCIADVDADSSIVQSAYQEVFSGGKLVSFEHQLLRKDGNIITVLNNSRALTDPTDKVIGVQSTLMDITQRRLAEETSLKNEARLNEAQRIANIGNWELDLLTNSLYWSDEIYRIWSMTPGQIEPTCEMLLDSIHPEDRVSVDQAYSKSLKTKTPYDIVHRLLLKDGSVKYVHERAETFYDDNGKQVRSSGTVQDVTERTLAQQAIVDSESNYRSIFENANDGIIKYGKNATLLDVNPAFTKITGLERDEVIGKRGSDLVKQLFSIKQVPRMLGIVKNALFNNLNKPIEFSFRDRILEVSTRRQGKDLGVAIMRDITLRREAEEDIREREERYRGLSEASFDAIFISEKGICIEQNQAAERLFGYTSSEAVGKMGTEWIVPEDRELVIQKMMTGNEEPYEVMALCKDGSTFHAEIQARMMHYGGRDVRVTALGDITERKMAEQALQHSEKKLLQAQSISKMGDFTWDLVTDRITWSLGMYELLKYDPDVSLNYDTINQDIHHPEDLASVGKWLTESIASGNTELIPKEYRLVCKDGEIVYVRTNGRIEHIDGTPIRLFGTCHNITDRKLAEHREQVLRELAQDLNSSTNIQSVGQLAAHSIRSFFKSDAFTIEFYDNNRRMLIGVYSEDTFNTGELPEEVPVTDMPFAEIRSDFFEANSMAHVRNRTTKDLRLLKNTRQFGSNRLSHSLLFAPIIWEQEAIGVIGVQSYTDHKYTEDDLPDIQTFANQIGGALVRAMQEEELRTKQFELKNSEEQFKAFTNQSIEGITVADMEGNYTFVNPTFCEMMGYSEAELLQMSVFDVKAPEQDKSIFAKSKGSKIGTPIEALLQRKDGTKFMSEVVGKMIEFGEKQSVMGIVRDITVQQIEADERKLLESQLRQSQKLEAVGTMVGGIAHDFNNILQSIFLYGELIQEQLPDNKELHENFQQIMDGGVRARELVKQILTFSRKSEIKYESQTIHEVILDALTFERASSPANIEIVQNVDMNCGQILCDKTQIHQILLNLCNNAKFAMSEDGGILEVSLAQVMISIGKGIPETDYLEIKVSDTGKGIDLDTVEKIFDPFFTTKAVGEGTGLGLSVIHGIVEMMNGKISVSSEMGKGTTFQILVPLTSGMSESMDGGKPVPRKLSGLTVLFVDDEESILIAGKSIMERRGYIVDIALDGDIALEKYESNPDKYDFIVTDQSMSRMSGENLAHSIRKLGSSIPIVLSSGNLEEDEKNNYKEKGISVFLHKPWTADQLIECLNELE